ncbi:hypothetical protein [Mycobacterium sp.]|uniref:hypothetical protein n=1 Tax=Mycobacterium sp. TaxID=1785 RepID=UPI003BAB1599
MTDSDDHRDLNQALREQYRLRDLAEAQAAQGLPHGNTDLAAAEAHERVTKSIHEHSISTGRFGDQLADLRERVDDFEYEAGRQTNQAHRLQRHANEIAASGQADRAAMLRGQAGFREKQADLLQAHADAAKQQLYELTDNDQYRELHQDLKTQYSQQSFADRQQPNRVKAAADELDRRAAEARELGNQKLWEGLEGYDRDAQGGRPDEEFEEYLAKNGREDYRRAVKVSDRLSEKADAFYNLRDNTDRRAGRTGMPRPRTLDELFLPQTTRTEIPKPPKEELPSQALLNWLGKGRISAGGGAGLAGSGSGNVIARDYEAISDGVGGLRRVLSKSESTLDQLHRTRAALTAGSEGQAVEAWGERLARLTEIQHRTISVTRRNLEYLDLANTEFRGFDHDLGRRFFGIL